jgi:hypothetical protein
VKCRLHGYPVHCVWKHGIRMAVNYAVDMWETLVDLAVDESFLIPLFRLRGLQESRLRHDIRSGLNERIRELGLGLRT